MNKELIRLLTSGTPPRAVVLGDLMLDRYVWGTTGRISPEAPVPVVLTSGEEERIGGAGNVCANLAAMGAGVRAVGVVGGDPEGRRVREILRQHRISAAGVRTEARRSTTLKVRIMARDQHLLRVDREEDRPISAATERSAIRYVARAGACADVILISDYDKGFLTPRIVRAAISAGRKAGIPVVVDPKRRDFGIYEGATVLKPNLREFQRAVGDGRPVLAARRGGSPDEKLLAAAGTHLLKRYGVGALVVTLGGDGMALFERGRRMRLFGTTELEAYDVTGAGDTALAALAYVLAVRGGLPEAIRIANVAAGAAVSKVGTAVVERKEIIGRLEDLHHNLSQKIKTIDELVLLLNARRSRHEKIAFTNGCFDVLHVGHIQLLKYARRQGDLLVVGVNSDASVRRLKGEGRPILDQEERTQILAALEDVDYIVTFDETSVLPLMRRIRPDIIVKGADYRKSEIVGREFVESYGGEVRLAPLEKGASTSSIVERIRGD